MPDTNAKISRRMSPTPLAPTGGFIRHDALYTANEVAGILKINRRTLERWRKDGIGPVVTRLHTNAPPRYRGADLLDALNRARETGSRAQGQPQA